MNFPQATPEIPVQSVELAIDHYVNVLGFTLDWGDENGGIAGISQGSCRLFLTNESFRGSQSQPGPVVIWLNVESKAEVDELFTKWRTAGAKIVSEPEDKPWNLREFSSTDLDGNVFRVFYDFSRG
jgi:hypothetical protein